VFLNNTQRDSYVIVINLIRKFRKRNHTHTGIDPSTTRSVQSEHVSLETCRSERLNTYRVTAPLSTDFEARWNVSRNDIPSATVALLERALQACSFRVLPFCAGQRNYHVYEARYTAWSASARWSPTTNTITAAIDKTLGRVFLGRGVGRPIITGETPPRSFAASFIASTASLSLC